MPKVLWLLRITRPHNGRPNKYQLGLEHYDGMFFDQSYWGTAISLCKENLLEFRRVICFIVGCEYSRLKAQSVTATRCADMFGNKGAKFNDL